MRRPGAAAADTSLFSRGRNSSASEKLDRAYSAGIKQSLSSDRAGSEADLIHLAAMRKTAEHDSRRENRGVASK